jgi:hypothetical protein
MAMQSNQIVLDKLPVSNYIVNTLANGKRMVELADLQITFSMSKSMATVVKLMCDDGRITADAIENKHKIVTDAAVLIHKIRRQLAPFGITIHSRRDVGYWMDDASKAILLKAIGPDPSVGQAEVSVVHEVPEDQHPDETDHTP